MFLKCYNPSVLGLLNTVVCTQNIATRRNIFRYMKISQIWAIGHLHAELSNGGFGLKIGPF